MSLRFCPDCEEFHRGRAVVCRPCARRRLELHVRKRMNFVSCETFEPSPVSDHRVPNPIEGNAETV